MVCARARGETPGRTLARAAFLVLVTLVALVGSAAAARAASGAASGIGCSTLPATGRPAPIICNSAASPASAAGTKRPLVLAFYGTDGSPQLMESLTDLDAVAARQGFVVAYPGSSDPVHPWAPWSDVSYVGSLIDELIATQNIDPARVYVTGFSAGGGEAWRIACRLSTKVAAIAVVAENAPVRPWGCTPARPVSQLLMVGTSDGQRWTGIPGLLLPPQGTAQRWAQIDGCPTGQPTQIEQPVPAVTQETWTSCADRSAVGLYIVGGAQHVWPLGGPGTPPGYSASQAIWDFFSPLRAAPVGLTSGDAQLDAVAVHGSARHPVIVARFRLAEAVTLVERLRGHPRLAHHTFRLRAGSRVLIKLRLPGSVKAGRYTVTFALTDAYGRSTTTSARVKLP